MSEIPMTEGRQKLIEEAKRQRTEVTQYLNDVAHWNETRGIEEGQIDPDPDGTVRETFETLERIISDNHDQESNR